MADLTLDSALRVHPRVSVRPEPFGALLYHFGTRRLSFLKSTRLLHVVEHLGRGSVRDALEAAGIDEGETPDYLAALRSLRDSDMLVAAT